MSEINDGGPAFPVEVYDFDKDVFVNEKGMTLRDYFAAKAMQTLLAEGYYEGEVCNGVAIDAYEMADAMLWARKKND
jgi:hypothetical protein